MGINHAPQTGLMDANPHYRKLFDKHEDLKQEIKIEDKHSTADESKLKYLKKLKLKIVDEMTFMERKAPS